MVTNGRAPASARFAENVVERALTPFHRSDRGIESGPGKSSADIRVAFSSPPTILLAYASRNSFSCLVILAIVAWVRR